MGGAGPQGFGIPYSEDAWLLGDEEWVKCAGDAGKLAANVKADEEGRVVAVNLRDCKHMKELPASVGRVKALTKLNLRGNTCRNEGIEALSEFLKTNKKITTLNLNENNLGTPGALKIADMLKVNSTLTEVDLSLNYIDDKGGKAISEALDANSTLKVLNMSGNEIEDKDLRKKCRSRRLA